MSKYRKRSLVIDAFRYVALELALETDWFRYAYEHGLARNGSDGLTLETLEGAMYVIPGDWIIKGIKGELYPIRNDIFIASYDEVRDSAE